MLRWPWRSSASGFDIKQTGDDLALGGMVLDEAHGGEPVVHIVFGVEFAQSERRAVVLLDQFHGTRRVVDLIGARPTMKSRR